MPLPTTFVFGSTEKVVSLPSAVTVTDVAETDFTVALGSIWFLALACADAADGQPATERASSGMANRVAILIFCLLSSRTCVDARYSTPNGRRPRTLARRVPDPGAHDLHDQQLARRDAAADRALSRGIRRNLGDARRARVGRALVGDAVRGRQPDRADRRGRGRQRQHARERDDGAHGGA